MSLNHKIDYLIKSDSSWKLVITAIWIFFISCIFLIVVRHSITQFNDRQSSLPLGGQYQLRSYKPFDLNGASAGSASAIGMQTVVFVNQNPTMSYLFSPSSEYPATGFLQLFDGAKVLSWRQVAHEKGLWVSQNFADIHGVSQGDSIDVGAKKFIVEGIIRSHTFVPNGFSGFVPLLVLSKMQAQEAGLLTGASRVDHFYFSNDASDPVLKRYSDSSEIVRTDSIETGSVIQNVTQIYQWIDIFVSLLFIWFCYGLSCVLSHHCTQIKNVQKTTFYLGVSKSMWYGRVRWLNFKVALMPCVILFAAVFWLLNVSVVAMGAAVILYFCWLVSLSYGQSSVFNAAPRSIVGMLVLMILLWAAWFQYAFNDLMQIFGYALVFMLFWALLTACLFYVLPKIYLICRRASSVALKWFVIGCRISFSKFRSANTWLAATIAVFLIVYFSTVTSNLLTVMVAKLDQNADNVFMINILPDQVAKLSQMIGQKKPFYPMIKGRLLARNGQALKVDEYDGWTQSSALKRDLNITYMSALPNGNKLIHGAFPAEGISIEKRLAEKLKVEVGDSLMFNVYGDDVTLPISSIRSVDWRRLNPNFFVIFPENSLKKYQASFLTSFFWRANDSDPNLIRSLTEEYPNLNFFFIDGILAMSRQWIEMGISYIQVLSSVVGLYALYMYYVILQSQKILHAEDRGYMHLIGMRQRDLTIIGYIEQFTMLLTAFVVGFLSGKMIGFLTSRYMFDAVGEFFVFHDIYTFGVYCMFSVIAIIFFSQSQQKSQ